ncbi:hypothetical protein SHLO109777_09340 [Shewanella loihica]|uniref:Uncharacterized protein n=1 Tax=Shewanella loihica (strain ATCC BAA-1088 / PV-4) TaxID=323850 RepID=A3QB78_SHELP|nr:hypothetical protein [Shewanella loihica]ABO22726.1 conserved hypothetical protein [Shewanella loihica PV-4]
MKNIPIHASIEGQARIVDTDWLAIMATLRERGLGQEELVVVYAQLSSYLRVTTRGLTLAMIPPSTVIEGITREVKHYANDYAGMM